MEPACTHSETETVLMPPGSRQYGRVLCKKCKRFLRWAPTPTVPLEQLHIPEPAFAGDEPQLTGSAAQVNWALSIRDSLLEQLDQWAQGDPLRRKVVTGALGITDAAWWIANKDAHPDSIKWPKAWLTPPAPRPVPEAKMAPPYVPPVRRAASPPQPALTLPSEVLDSFLEDCDSRPVRRSARPPQLRPVAPPRPPRSEPPPEVPAPEPERPLRQRLASAAPRSFSAAPAPTEERPFSVELTPGENGLHQLFVSFDGRSGGTLRMLPEEMQKLHRHLSEYLTKLSNKPELDE